MFFERYHDVMKAGGRLISIIDDGILSGETYADFRDFLRSRFLIRAVVSLPGDAFQRSHTSGRSA
jgi:type I restriction enzyme M protein